ncbi:hypothetical protein [Paenibacillus aceris]|uniref:Uncharacterized protein n=1 Tax=Paenibacillus aceris TaxID=869555 RepID=A0ABS4I5I2_9BACL|nr:hypothetical protein [Paenibacillus aceris]MBP1965364.1 hypothetical protein [Paenibacillus aceris]NHW36046.1 hypothetical protein [Paenibacillus aceris]
MRDIGSSANECDTIVNANGLNENVGLVTLSNTETGSSYVTVRPQTQGGVRLTGKATDGVTNSLVKKLQKTYETSTSDRNCARN